MMRCCEANKLQMRFLKKTKNPKKLKEHQPNKSPKEEQLNKQTKQNNQTMNPEFSGFFCFQFVKLKIGDDKFQGSTNFKKFEKTYLRKRKEGRKGGREGGDEP
jgi:hypothetical protein